VELRTRMSSPVGNLVDLAEGQLLLPSFVVQRDNLYIDLSAIDSRELFLQFVERVFASGAYFADIEYPLFLNLLFLWEPDDIGRELERYERMQREPLLRLAREIRPFPDERRAIYRGAKIGNRGQTAEYLFEHVTIERPAPAEAGPDAEPIFERLYLDFDEFVAALWMQGIRYGIDVAAVREAIERDKVERITVASFVQPTEGKDASILEQTRQLHRDDAPKLRSDGRMDLCQYQNRFPQVKSGIRLFKKLPRVPGVSGWDVAGKELPPATVKDFDIATLSGPGTQVVKESDGEYVVAVHDGFLDIDTDSGMLSVVDKIVNRQGVSMRTTGDLALEGDEFEEHGEVQEKRVVSGHHMTFLSDVFGEINSNGGRILLKRNISGGAATSPHGEIHIEGNASRAMLEARGGSIEVAQAETSVIIGGTVHIERAILCDIVAEEVTIGIAEGCSICAKRVKIGNSTARKDSATAVMLPLPSMEGFDRRAQRLDEDQAAAEKEIEQVSLAWAELSAVPDMKTYLSLQPRIKSGALKMNSSQQVQWQGLLTRLGPTLRQFAGLNQTMQENKQRLAEIDESRESLKREREEAVQELFCEIEKVSGDTLVRSHRRPFDATAIINLPPKELHKTLSEMGPADVKLYSGSSGKFSWTAVKPEDEKKPAV
jgi:uncharacterized protein (DUF342 family)